MRDRAASQAWTLALRAARARDRTEITVRRLRADLYWLGLAPICPRTRFGVC